MTDLKIKHGKGGWKAFREKWSDFLKTAFVPNTLFFAIMTVILIAFSWLPFNSFSEIHDLAKYIPHGLYLLSVVFAGLTVKAYLSNDDSVVRKERILDKGIPAVRGTQNTKEEIKRLIKFANNRNISKQEMGRHLERLLQQADLLERYWFDLLPELQQDDRL